MTSNGPAPAPRFSVIVPVYNGGGLLRECLSAIKAQEGLPAGEVEVIVVDDGSTDGSIEIIGAGEGARTPKLLLCDQLIRLPENRGAAFARNRGAQAARADILVFVDADVFLAPDALARLKEFFGKHPEAAAAVGRYTERPAAAGLINAYHNAFTRFHHDLSPREMDWFWGALGSVKKSAFLAVGGFDERYQGASAEDMELGLTLSRAGHRLFYCPEAEGAHAHHFTLFGMFVNDYQKAVLGTKLRLRGQLPRRAPGFANFRNLVTAPLLLIFLWTFLAFTSFSLLVAFFCLGLVIIVNDPFYLYLSKTFPRGLGYALLLHWTQMTVISCGALIGALGDFLGRSPYGRPGWR